VYEPVDQNDEVNIPEGSDVNERIAVVYENLHNTRSGDYVRASFTDLELLLEWSPPLGGHRKIFPFRYYYSPEADLTFVICNIERTVAICEGYKDSIVDPERDMNECEVAKQYLGLV